MSSLLRTAATRIVDAFRRVEHQPVSWPRDRAGMVPSGALREDLPLLMRRVAGGDVILVLRHGRAVAALVPPKMLEELAAALSYTPAPDPARLGEVRDA